MAQNDYDIASKRITTGFRRAMFGWAPGFFAGVLPLIAFLFVCMIGNEPGRSPPITHEKLVSGMVTHLLVMAMVSSAVALAMALIKVVEKPLPGFLRDGFGPVLCFLLLLMEMVIATVLYVLFEAGLIHEQLWMGASICLVAALLLTFYMEVSIERLYELGEIRGDPAT